MKKILLSASLFVGAILMVNAQDFVISNFLEGREAGQDLEVGAYAGTTQGAANPFQQYKWILTGKPNSADKEDNQGGVSPVIVSSTLTYPEYVGADNSLAIQLARLSGGVARFSVFGVANNNVYNAGTYYAAFMVKIEQVASPDGADFFMFDGNYTGTTQRARLFVKNSSESSKFVFGLAENASAPAVVTGDYDKGDTFLLVLKYEFGVGAKLFVNPAIAATEPATAELSVNGTSLTTSNGIRAIDLRQRATTEMEIGGIRFSNNWVQAVGFDEGPNAIAGETADKGNVVSVKYFNLNGVEVNEPVNANNVYVKKAVYEDGSVETTKVVK